MRKKLMSICAAIAVALGLSIAAAAPASAGIQLWTNANYNGYLGDFGTGTSYVGSAADNRASSLKVTSPANYAVLYQFRDYGGCYTGRFYYGWYDLSDTTGYAVYGGCVGFNDRTSSIG
ncbi:hypothetical protein [Microbacterium sp.]|uniref:hypothetical protein n=1 Tax=Microbacterium sp. TaxID=51671 RepID=UPI003A915C68